ncbi:uncharacterized protein PHACADRAFT_249761 [Phanerochaete carnosa HHB-10118-sp]|uniref:Uncharacterized protein n=1 Tax=Phanerochaete carnosa (strain HHB-10118-sp) TaxID=650164 RepID=K5V959_PHACS|nr:uncharacterized protein PHACADRAFT_249761 [Phanerochaete carnosa HHB-10118-sp]EKM59336.1 hypothetical protein PHACADRAFT_249761 [Phanerochaete carnosa HHB-10118-sp]
MVASLAGKTVVVVGATSGIGYGVAKACLLSQAAHVVVVGTTKEKAEHTVQRLRTDIAAETASAPAGTLLPVSGTIASDALDAHDLASVRAFCDRVGEIDHLVWTSGDPLRVGFPQALSLDEHRDAFDVRFWGAAQAAQSIKIRKGGSITLTIGSGIARPRQQWSLAVGVLGAVDALVRGLAVDLAPVRVNVVCPGVTDTELWRAMDPVAKQNMFEAVAKTLPVGHIGSADEVAEAYLFLMKCSFVTGQRIEVDGGNRLS